MQRLRRRPVATGPQNSGMKGSLRLNVIKNIGQMSPTFRQAVLLGSFVLILVSAYYLLSGFGLLATLTDSARLGVWITDMGPGGAVAIVGLMAIAVIINPIPSAPIALAAGAMYGHTWGTLYVVTGAALGALGAFGISRLLGYNLWRRFFGARFDLGWLGSQNSLMGLVFVSRLLPFLSFDMVSYGAGLTTITTWRFFVATVVGLVPASFLLAHFGGEMSASSLDQALLILLLLGGMTLIPILGKGLSGWRRHQTIPPANEDVSDKSLAGRYKHQVDGHS